MAPRAANKSQNREAPPEDPIVDCTVHPEQCPPVYGDQPGNGPFFSSTEGRGSFVSQENPTGAIVNIAAILDRTQIPSGYFLLAQDLNAGCSNLFSTPQIYLIFTRDPAACRAYFNRSGDPGPHIITGIAANREWGYTWNDHYDYVARKLNPWGTGPNNTVQDLNEGVGGQTINAEVVFNKGAFQQPEIEIAVIDAQSNSNPSLPTGWVKVNQDLNEGASGHYMYLCYKNR